MTEETFVCSTCGESHPLHECTAFEGEDICSHCLDTETRVCQVCGERIWRDDNAGDENTPLCEYCYERHYTSCARCGALLPLDDAYYLSDDSDDGDPLCHDCYLLRSADREIHNYYYKPDAIFYVVIALSQHTPKCRRRHQPKGPDFSYPLCLVDLSR